MRHDAHGHWLAEAGIPDPFPGAEGELSADVVVVGGGYTGLWAAWWIKRCEPGAEVVLLEEDVCGAGPSGRNGGFCNSMWFSLPNLRRRFGDRAALETCEAAAASVGTIGEWCEQNGVDAHYRRGGYLQAATSEAQSEVWPAAVRACEELGVADRVRVLDRAGAREICASPVFRSGVHYRDAATVQPALLVAGLRRQAEEIGVRIHERTPVRSIDRVAGGVEARFDGGKVLARKGILATGSRMQLGGIGRQMTLTTSHMVVTEPVPEVLAELGWDGGECITDSRAMIHYFRTTRDGRIAFGWGGGRVAFGAKVRPRSEVDAAMARQVGAALIRFFPALEDKRITHAWGGPIDASPAHLPMVHSRGEHLHAAFGYTGNGVGPAQMIGRSLASLALERTDEASRLALVDPELKAVPPEPFRYIGGTAIRRALLRKERLEEEDRKVDPVTRLISGIPERIGFHVGR